jgi:hypothetical protein
MNASPLDKRRIGRPGRGLGLVEGRRQPRGVARRLSGSRLRDEEDEERCGSEEAQAPERFTPQVLASVRLRSRSFYHLSLPGRRET